MTTGDASDQAAGSGGGPAAGDARAAGPSSAGERPALAEATPREDPEAPAPNISAAAVLSAVFVIAISGLVYELLAGTVASYLLGDSVTQFSTVIGVYLSAMGLGAWLSGFIDRKLLVRFVEIELALALVGGVSSSFLFFAFSRTSAFQVVLYGTVILIGTLVGLELPLLLRILQTRYALKDLVQAAGLRHPREISPLHIVRRTSQHQVRLLANELSFVAPGALLEAMEGRAAWPAAVFSLYWPMARADSFGAAAA